MMGQTAPTTTLVAVRSDTGHRIAITDVSLEELRALSDQHLLSCPHCSGLLLLKAGTVRLHHFAHVVQTDCATVDHEPETDEHRRGKLALFQHFRIGSQYAAMEQHLAASNQRADIYIEKDNQGYALEFQQANNTAEHWLTRHKLYQDQKVFDVWFLGQVRYQPGEETAISRYDPLPVPRQEYDAASGTYRIREMEKAMLTVRRVLNYLDPVTQQLTILLAREVRNNTLRAYRYRVMLKDGSLRNGQLHTPLDDLLNDYYSISQ